MGKIMEQDHFLSVIIPVYNVENTLKRAVYSVIKQNYLNIEILLIDDGSTDSSGKISDQLSEKYSFIKSYHKANGGLSSARNYGLNLVQGDIIAFLDSDDYYMDGIFEKSVSLFDDSQVDIVIFGIKKGSEEENILLLPQEKKECETQKMIENLFINKGIDFYTWNKLYRRKLFDNIRFPEGVLYEDIIPSYELTKLAKETVYLQTPGIFYFQNTESIVYQVFNPKQYDNILQRQLLFNRVKTDFPKLESLSVDKLLDGYLSTGFKLTSKIHENELQKKYLKKARTEVKESYFLFMKNSKSSFAKKVALNIFLLNSQLYNLLYKIVLKK